ncbi:hypothetical protein [Lelliottia sp. WAP21]|uniref:hypothetical protein n=1 Tax=Lelliottia sp. WAP21 TaxID=2877426 RepID=UPI001F1B725D|nr:hypothetical protein [Lelliottia sp. WAP21]
MARIAADQYKFEGTPDSVHALRSWLIECLRILPDAISVIHADDNGHFIRLPYIEEKPDWDLRKGALVCHLYRRF